MPKLTREEFERWLAEKKTDVRVWPYAIAPCACGDVNCKGWRLVPATEVS